MKWAAITASEYNYSSLIECTEAIQFLKKCHVFLWGFLKHIEVSLKDYDLVNGQIFLKWKFAQFSYISS